MTKSSLSELLSREPFRPFRIHLSSGGSYEVRNPDLVVVMKSEVFVALPSRDRWALIPLLHIAAIESLENGHARRPRRGAR